MLDVMERHTIFVSLLGLKWRQQPATLTELYDDKHILINETAIEKLGLQGDPIGQKVGMGNQDYIVAGILKDFNFQSLQDKVGLLCLFVGKDTASGWGTTVNGCLFAKIRAHVNVPTLIGDLKRSIPGTTGKLPSPTSSSTMPLTINTRRKTGWRPYSASLPELKSPSTAWQLFALATFSAQCRSA